MTLTINYLFYLVGIVLVVVAGNGFATTTIKHFADRVRPSFNPDAAALGPSFPSGHSATAAAFYAAAALILGRASAQRTRQILAAAAVAIAAAVASSRVLLDFHWLSDVVGGLSLGWAWFALCSVAFGGRLLAPTAGVDVAAAQAAAPTARRTVATTTRPRHVTRHES